jgi:uncharacterized tellurite resistance protein B-like protein
MLDRMGIAAYPLIMIQQLFDILSGASGGLAAGKPDRLQIAVAALLAQAASMDDHFDEAERRAIEALLASRFTLGRDAVARLIAAAEAASSGTTQLYPFVRLVVERLDEAERIELIEMLWEVAYADGVLHPDEDALVRRVAGLIYVSDRDRGEARKRVLERRGAGPRADNEGEPR